MRPDFIINRITAYAVINGIGSLMMMMVVVVIINIETMSATINNSSQESPGNSGAEGNASKWNDDNVCRGSVYTYISHCFIFMYFQSTTGCRLDWYKHVCWHTLLISV